MKQVPEGMSGFMPCLRPTGAATPTPAADRRRQAFAVRPWRGSLISTMPSLGEGHGAGYQAKLTHGTRRLKEPST